MDWARGNGNVIVDVDPAVIISGTSFSPDAFAHANIYTAAVGHAAIVRVITDAAGTLGSNTIEPG